MPKTASIFLIFFVFASCKYKENSWLNNYKEIKCKYAKIEELRRNDSLNKINKLGKELAEIKTEISKIDKPIIEELANLENSRSEIVVEYLSKSNQIIDQQTDKFGHNSTPEFEKKLSQNEKEANSKTKVFENKIEFLNQKLAENNKYQELKAKEGKIKSEIAEEYISIKEKYSKQLENLQYDLNYLNAQFKKLTSNLNTQELKTLTKKETALNKIRVTLQSKINKMNRKDFLKSGLILGGATLLPTNSVFSQSLIENKTDLLVDKDGNFFQQPLLYSESFLEPFMDAETLHLHYTFHHGGAVKGANKDLQMIKKSLDENNLETVDYWTRKLSYHLSSHILHSIFWTNLTNKANLPKGDLLKRIEKDFGSFDKLKMYLAKTSKDVDGNGWGILGYQPYTDKLTILQCENHEKLTQWGVIPLLVIDVWEHAYYLKFRNKRTDFVDNLFSIINWDNASERLENALKMMK